MKFSQGSDDDVCALIAENPLAWLVSSGAAGFEATPLPLLAERDESGALVALLGHCSRANKQVADLRADPTAHILFAGVQGYISPSIVRQPRWIPTWSYAVAVIAVDVEFIPDDTEHAVAELTTAMEAANGTDWSLDEARDRVGGMIGRIIAFRAHVRDVDSRFNLRQEESLETLTDIITGVRDPALARWTERMNAHRLTQVAAS